MINWHWLKASYPFEHSVTEKRDTIISLTLFASLILLLLQPYGFIAINRLLMSAGYMVISVTLLMVNFFGFPKLFPLWFEESRWSVLRAFLFLLYNFLIIGLWTHIFQSLIIKNDLAYLISGHELFIGLAKIMMIGLGASVLLVLVRYNIMARKHLQVSQELNNQLREKLHKLTPIDTEQTIELILEKKLVAFKRSELNFIKSEGNYISLYLASDKSFTPALYRARMKETQEALSAFPEFFRCHRSYLVNLNRIESTHGNSQGLFIKVFGEETKIPVARPKIRFLKARIADNSF
ncbi:LytR/AlgR family response regulator transcription factor [Winogradskyella sp.]|uniref:LytR/AlgR family response regulator transcription factor n=1 Tax=Winogradskyella sp. TaxID=1883156 RepID=UPI003BACBD3A